MSSFSPRPCAGRQNSRAVRVLPETCLKHIRYMRGARIGLHHGDGCPNWAQCRFECPLLCFALALSMCFAVASSMPLPAAAAATSRSMHASGAPAAQWRHVGLDRFQSLRASGHGSRLDRSKRRRGGRFRHRLVRASAGPLESQPLTAEHLVGETLNRVRPAFTRCSVRAFCSIGAGDTNPKARLRQTSSPNSACVRRAATPPPSFAVVEAATR